MAAKHSQAAKLISLGVFDGVKSFHEFEQRVSALFLLNTKAQGDAFEVFVEAYLATQPIIQCQESWPVGFIPTEIREALNLPNDSKGIDGVYKSALDVYVPYQVKFRSNRPALGFNEVAPFLGITEKATDRILITNCDTIAIDVQNRTGIRSLRGVDFDQLTYDDFTVIENWLKKKPKKRQALTPDPYQIEALNNIANHFESNDRGTVVMACGTGKTLVALWAAEQSNAKSILVLVPSLTLLQQTLEEWSAQNSWGKDFSYLCVCSDPTVNLKNDEIEIDPSDVPFRIDTDPEIVRGYLGQENRKTKIVFSTYQSSQVVSQATKGGFEFDIAIFDEAHKTTGPVEGRFAFGLKDENIKIKKRLFLTATPKHYDISKRDKEGEFKFSSMDDEKVYGKRAHTLTFGDAASKGIICPYKVVITLIDKHQISDFALKNGITFIDGDATKAKWVGSQIAVRSAIEHTSATKIITFHSRVKNAEDFAVDETFGIKKFIDNFEVFHVHGKQKSNERKEIILNFKNASQSLITNAKCLTEGIDVPAVDMVAFIDPRHSKIDIAQAVGRAMRKPRGGHKKFGFIVVPLFAADVSGQSLEKAIKSENFDDVALILNSLLEQDNELAEIVSELKQAKGRGDLFNPDKFKGKIEVIGPLIGLDKLTTSIYAQAVDRLGESWDEWYGKLTKFKEREGHVRVHKDHTEDGFSLGNWVSRLRSEKHALSKRRLELLSKVDFVWNALDEKWEEGYYALINFNKREGHFKVPQSHIEDGFHLGNWVRHQRAFKSGKKLSTERIDRLNELGFIWDPIQDAWNAGLNSLIKFKELEGHCKVPKSHIQDGYTLGRWVNGLRTRKVDLDIKKKNQLIEVGFVWDPFSDAWDKGLRALIKFKKREGHCSVPKDHVEDGYRLGNWVDSKRTKKGKISAEQIRRLDKLGFIWNPYEAAWEKGLSELIKFKELEGHCRVPKHHMFNGYGLGGWTSRARRLKDKLPATQLNQLNELGFDWNPRESAWEEGLSALIKFKDREGHCLVPRGHIEDGYRLFQWLGVQKRSNSKLTTDQLHRLSVVGVILNKVK